jgi:hypothetical protein
MTTTLRWQCRERHRLSLFIAAVATALLVIPALRRPPKVDSLVNVPSMTNVPAPGSFHIEPQ